MFLAPWFLAGLIAIGVPLWLHRIARTERIKVPFASLMLLEASEVRDTSRRSLRYWLLLAARIGLILLLALAFAQPLMKSNSLARGADAKLQAIVLDTSMSMNYGDRWSRAIKEAQKLIDNMSDGDQALLVAASGRKIEVLAGPVSAADKGILRSALGTLNPGVERLDYGMLMSSSATWLGLKTSGTSFAGAQLHLITDVQQSASPLRFADLAPPEKTQIVMHDVGVDEPVQNMAIVGVAVHGAEERTFTVSLAGNDSSDARLSGKMSDQSREILMSIDDREYPAQRVSADPSGQTQITFPPLKLRPGSHKLKLELRPHDLLPQDDVYVAVIDHSEPAVLLITHDPTADETAYLASAIESQSDTRLTVESATPQTLAKVLEKKPLHEYAAVFVADSGILSEGTAHQLAQYVDAGGAVLATLGPKAAQLAKEPITGLAIARTSTAEQRVAFVDDSHPVLRDASGWNAVRFMRRIEVKLDRPQDRTLISLADRSPLLIERIGQAGRLLLLTAPLDRSWNDLPIHSLFVRFIADAAGYLTAHDVNAVSYTVGSRIATGVVAGAGGQIFDPNGARALSLDDAAEASYFTPTLSGIYEVRSGRQKRWLAVNPDVREADLSPMSADTVTRWSSLAAQSAPTTVVDKKADAKDEPPGRSFGWNVLIVALALLIIELLLANYRLTIRRDGGEQGGSLTASAATNPLGENS